MANKYYVYFLKSKIVDRYYIGCTTNLENRLQEHNKGRTKSTKPYVPWELVYMEEFVNKSDAFKREWYLKHPKGYLEKIKIINNLNNGEVA